MPDVRRKNNDGIQYSRRKQSLQIMVPAVTAQNVNGRSSSSEIPPMSSSSRSGCSSRVPGSSASPGARKKKMALPRRILRLLESSKRLQFQNVSLSKKRKMCVKHYVTNASHTAVVSTLRNSSLESLSQRQAGVVKETTSGSHQSATSERQSDKALNGECSKSKGRTEFQSSLCQPAQDIVAIDCEMAGTGPKGRVSALARCSIVDHDGVVIYDQYVKPDEPVTDYRTKWSGVRPGNLADAISFAEAHSQVSNILKDKIVVGHAIINDFQALGLSHPAESVRDTSRCRPLAELFGKHCKPGQHTSLKALARNLLQLEIQRGEHSSVEDAQATMRLYRMVEERWEEELQSAFPDQSFRTSFLDDHFWPDDLF